MGRIQVLARSVVDSSGSCSKCSEFCNEIIATYIFYIRHDCCAILAYGKGEELQRIVPTNKVFSVLEYLWMAQTSVRDREPEENEPMFAPYNGNRFANSYATWQLQNDPPMDIYTLAINMRTSVKIIEDYYSDVVPADRERALHEW